MQLMVAFQVCGPWNYMYVASLLFGGQLFRAEPVRIRGVYFLLILFKFASAISLTRKSTSPNRVSIWELETISPLVYAFLRDSAFYFFL